jgi:hypothetical protein
VSNILRIQSALLFSFSISFLIVREKLFGGFMACIVLHVLKLYLSLLHHCLYRFISLHSEPVFVNV